MKLSEELVWRGFIKDRTFNDIEFIDTPHTYYLGADLTSDSLTIGNLAVFMLARKLIKAGWKSYILVGGATSLIGDPGGKNEERQLLERQLIQTNIEGIKKQLSILFSGEEFNLVNNYDWLKTVNILDFLRDVGKFFNMTELVQREYITERIGKEGKGISYAEFSYSLLQGYDFWHLNKNYGVDFQIGGSDQWGNMLSGVSLIRKKEQKDVNALSIPLTINQTTGVKFGKSEEGTIWLDGAKTSPVEFYQFWITLDDLGVEYYLKIYTELSHDEISAIMAKHAKNPEKRFAQQQLAYWVTCLIHSEEKAKFAEHVTEFLNGTKHISEASEQEITEIRRNIPSIKVQDNASIIQTLVETNLASSNSDARRLIKDNAITVNNIKINKDSFETNDFINGRLMIRRGKSYKDSALVEI